MRTVNNKIEYLRNVRELLINIDMVNGFVREGALAAPSIARVVPRQVELIKEALGSNEKGLAFVRDAHKANAVEFQNYPPHCLIGSRESALIDELKPYEKEALVYLKNSTNLIFAPHLQTDLLLLRNLERVYLTGCLSEVCVLHGALGLKTFFDQANKKIEVGVYPDAIDTFDAPNHNANMVTEEALKFMQNNGIKILSKKKEM